MNFLGAYSVSDLLASVTTGVQTTGTSLWPLFVFVGIGVAFVIASYVVSFIRHSIGGTKSSGYEETYTPAQMSAISAKIQEIEARPGAGYP